MANLFHQDKSKEKKVTSFAEDDPLRGLKKGLLMSSASPIGSPPTVSNVGSFINVNINSKLYLNGALNMNLGSHDITPASTTTKQKRNAFDMSPLTSVTASYQNVDFLAVPEPYKIV